MVGMSNASTIKCCRWRRKIMVLGEKDRFKPNVARYSIHGASGCVRKRDVFIHVKLVLWLGCLTHQQWNVADGDGNYGFGGKGISFFTYGYFGSIFPTKKVQGCPGQLKFGKKHSCKWFPRQFFETINITCAISPSKVANSQSFRSRFPASFHEKARLNVFCWPILLLFLAILP